MRIETPDYAIIVESRKPITREMRDLMLLLDDKAERLNKFTTEELMLYLLEDL